MPLYDFECEAHGRWEALTKIDAESRCGTCGTPGRKLVSMPASTPSLWNSGWNAGLSGNGFFSYSAGRNVSSKREEEKIMNAKGFVNIKDLGGESFEDSFIAGKHRERDEHEALITRYRDNIDAFGGDKIRAMTETFPAKQMLEETP